MVQTNFGKSHLIQRLQIIFLYDFLQIFSFLFFCFSLPGYFFLNKPQSGLSQWVLSSIRGPSPPPFPREPAQPPQPRRDEAVRPLSSIRPHQSATGVSSSSRAGRTWGQLPHAEGVTKLPLARSWPRRPNSSAYSVPRSSAPDPSRLFPQFAPLRSQIASVRPPCPEFGSSCSGASRSCLRPPRVLCFLDAASIFFLPFKRAHVRLHAPQGD